MVTGGIVAAVAAGLFGMLVSWLFALRAPEVRGTDSYPDWYTDPFDTSWQQPLASPAVGGLGLSSFRPVQVCGVHGEQAYLASLLCEGEPSAPPFPDPFAVLDATRETVQRAFRSKAVDRYEVPCAAGPVIVYLSPYHCERGATPRTPQGFEPRFPADS